MHYYMERNSKALGHWGRVKEGIGEIGWSTTKRRKSSLYHWATGLKVAVQRTSTVGKTGLAVDQTVRVSSDKRVQHPFRSLREDTFYPPKIDSTPLGQAGILTHKRMLQFLFKINDADIAVHSFQSAPVIWLSMSTSRSSGANTGESCSRNSGGADVRGIPRLFAMSGTLQQGTIQRILDIPGKYTQILYTNRQTLWTNTFKHVNCSSATDAQRGCSRLKGLGYLSLQGLQIRRQKADSVNSPSRRKAARLGNSGFSRKLGNSSGTWNHNVNYHIHSMVLKYKWSHCLYLNKTEV